MHELRPKDSLARLWAWRLTKCSQHNSRYLLMASLLKRLCYLKQSGIYRQTLLGNIGLIVATLLKRI